MKYWLKCIVVIIIIFFINAVFKKSASTILVQKYKPIIKVFDSIFKIKNKQALIIPLPNEYKIYADIVYINNAYKIQADIIYTTINFCTSFLNKGLQKLFATNTKQNTEDKNNKNAKASFLYRQNKCLENFSIINKKENYLTPETKEGFRILLHLDKNIEGEYYTIRTNVYSKTIVVSGNSRSLFYGVVSLLQLCQNHFNTTTRDIYFNAIDINDGPKFHYRGMHLDVARHFFSTDVVKKYLDFLAFYKINKFHWHLTDDQGWRIEIKQYPKLTSIGSYRPETIIGRDNLAAVYPTDGTAHAGFYTQAEIKEIVAYAKLRNIDIIPEIDLPGHAMAMIASYPELACFKKDYKVLTRWRHTNDLICASKESTYKIIGNILQEVQSLFPYHSIHLGGDESELKIWAKCENCLAKMTELKLSPKGLLQYFFNKLGQSVPDKKIVLWDDEYENSWNINKFILMCWKGDKNVTHALKKNINVILNSNEYYYLDHYQSPKINKEPIAFKSISTLKDIYLHPINFEHLYGIQGALWTEYIQTPQKLEYMLLPRLLAIGEIAWTNKARLNFQNFAYRLSFEKNRFVNSNINFYSR